MSFGLIECKKDAAEILDLVSDDANKGMKELAGRKLVGFKDQYNNVQSTILPREATHIELTNTTIIKYHLSNDTKVAHLTPGLQPSQTYIIWTIVDEFTNFVCGDLAFYATIQGRDGTSNCRCPYCTLSAHEWKMELADQPPSAAITLPLLEKNAALYIMIRKRIRLG